MEIHADILEMPIGYEARTDDGQSLSGGQRPMRSVLPNQLEYDDSVALPSILTSLREGPGRGFETSLAGPASATKSYLKNAFSTCLREQRPLYCITCKFEADTGTALRDEPAATDAAK